MQYRPLGRTGIQVSPYALGTLMFATVMGNAPEDSARIIGKALDAGINLIDTADAYGDSEEIVGQALQGRRDEVVLATKFGRPIGQDPNHQGASRRWIVTAVENSLRRLRTDYIDLYQLHRPDPRTDIEETLSALTDLIHSGKVRAIGASQTPASGIVEAQWVAERRGLARRGRSLGGGFVEEVAHGQLEDLQDLEERVESDLVLALLHAREIGLRDADLLGQLRLRETAALAQLADARADERDFAG